MLTFVSVILFFLKPGKGNLECEKDVENAALDLGMAAVAHRISKDFREGGRGKSLLSISLLSFPFQPSPCTSLNHCTAYAGLLLLQNDTAHPLLGNFWISFFFFFSIALLIDICNSMEKHLCTTLLFRKLLPVSDIVWLLLSPLSLLVNLQWKDVTQCSWQTL